MKRLSFVLTVLILLFCVNAWGTDWYVGPSSGEYGAEDGVSPETAWDGLTDITWGAGGVQPGDTLYLLSGTYTTYMYLYQSGTSGNRITITAYDQSNMPVLSCSDPDKEEMLLFRRNFINISYIIFKNPSYRALSIIGSHDITVDHCTFTADVSYTTGRGFIAFAMDSYDIYNCIIRNCTFENIDDDWACIFSLYGAGDGNGPDEGTFHDIIVENCKFTNCYDGVHFKSNDVSYVDPSGLGGENGISPYRITIQNNIFVDCMRSAILINTGLRSAYKDIIKGNIAINTGSLSVPNINVFQLGWIRNAVISDNIIDGVETSSCDGHGIILDWIASNDAYASDGVIVTRNIVKNLHPTGCSGGTGIYPFKAKNCTISYNLSYNNEVAGIKFSQTVSTGNIYTNNTCYGNKYGVFAASSCAASTLENNIFANNQYGIGVSSGATRPTEAHNCFYGNTLYNFYDWNVPGAVALDTTSITFDPKFVNSSSNNFHLSSTSSCRDGGILNAGDPYSEVVYDLDGRRVTQPDGTEYYLNSQPIGCYLYRREFESRYVNGIDYKKMNRILEGCSGDGNDDVKIINGLRY